MADGPLIFDLQIAVSQTRIARFRSNLVWSLITWEQINIRCLRSKGQRLMFQRDVTYQQ